MRRPPRGFERVTRGRLRALVRTEAVIALGPLLEQWARRAERPGRALPGGRGGAQAFDVEPTLSVVLRPYLRGGLIRHLSREHYFGFRPRPFRELMVTETLRARGVPTVDVLAAAACWVLPGCYRGALISREVAGASTLWQCLRSAAPAERERIAAAAAAATRTLHAAGGIHPDLNLQNYLVSRVAGGYEVRVIDLDGVRLRPATQRDRQAAFDRICRSIRRLDPAAEVVTLACIEALHAITAE